MKALILVLLFVALAGCISTEQHPYSVTVRINDTAQFTTSTIPPFHTETTIEQTTTTEHTTTSCPQYSPPTPDFCKGGTLYPPIKDIHGCLSPPICYLPANSTTTTTIQTSFAHKIRIGSWNLQRYGPTKAANDEKVRQITNKINDYDIMIVQEVTDSSGAAFNKLCAYLPSYKCFASDRIGSDTYKEQYGIIYKDAELINSYMISSNAIERGPFVLEFKSDNWNFNIVTLHTRPNNVSLELTALEYILDTNPRFANDTVVIGDLNADCDYYPYILNLDDWTWGITSDEDTTTGKTVCAYDRIIFNKEASDNFVKAGIDRNIASGISDHYPIFAIFDTSHK